MNKFLIVLALFMTFLANESIMVTAQIQEKEIDFAQKHRILRGGRGGGSRGGGFSGGRSSFGGRSPIIGGGGRYGYSQGGLNYNVIESLVSLVSVFVCLVCSCCIIVYQYWKCQKKLKANKINTTPENDGSSSSSDDEVQPDLQKMPQNSGQIRLQLEQEINYKQTVIDECQLQLNQAQSNSTQNDTDLKVNADTLEKLKKEVKKLEKKKKKMLEAEANASSQVYQNTMQNQYQNGQTIYQQTPIAIGQPINNQNNMYPYIVMPPVMAPQVIQPDIQIQQQQNPMLFQQLEQPEKEMSEFVSVQGATSVQSSQV